jgi:uncharacterized protein with FMN-binding domain
LRRALLTIGGTVAGLAALLSFKTHPLGALASTAPPAPAAGSSSATPPAAQGIGSVYGTGQGGAPAKPASTAKQGSTVRQGSTAKPAATTGRGSGATGAGGSAAGSARTFTGSVASTQYGPVQVAVTVAGTRITKVTVLQQTNEGAQSSQIDATAIPQLKSETLAAQSAHIDAVSGATYTSSGYKQSLQSALDQAGV